ncbi:MAG: tetratricopeptide repeat protein [Anaerolineae bacterium]
MSESRFVLADSYEGLLEQARDSWEEGDLAGAETFYRRLVEKLGRLSDPVLARRPELQDMHREARLEFSVLLSEQGRYAEAIEVEEVLLNTHPDEAVFWRTDLAILRLAKGETEAGLAELQTLAEKNPGDPSGWLVLGREMRIEGRFGESQAALDRAWEVGREADPQMLALIHYERFRLFKEMGRLDDALAAWEESVKLDADLKVTIRQVYQMLTQAGRYSEALGYVARDDNEMQAGFQRGLIASLRGEPAKARQEWQKVAEMDPDEFEFGHDTWVESVLRLGDPVPALNWLRTALREFRNVRLLVLAGIGWAMQHNHQLAAKLFQGAISILRTSRPSKQKLDSAEWRLLDSLIVDEETKAALKPYFAVVETVWG